MIDDVRPLILDADGVFLSERPYWNAALGAALRANGLGAQVAGRWDLLADIDRCLLVVQYQQRG